MRLSTFFATPSPPLMRRYLISGKCRYFWTAPKSFSKKKKKELKKKKIQSENENCSNALGFRTIIFLECSFFTFEYSGHY